MQTDFSDNGSKFMKEFETLFNEMMAD